MAQKLEKNCLICDAPFVGFARRCTCGSFKCRAEWQRQSIAEWRIKNKARIKAWQANYRKLYLSKP